MRTPFFYGWIVVAVCAVNIALAFGVRLSFGIFYEALLSSGEFAWSRANAAGVFSLTMIVFALTSAPFGWLLDRWGPRRVFLLGLLLMASGLAATSRMNGLLQFYLFYGAWTGLGITSLGLSIQAATISRWFGRSGRRGLAIGIAFAGTGIGILVMAPVVERIITVVHWRTAFLALSLILAGVGLPLTWFFLRNTPQELGQQPDGSTSSLATPDQPAPNTRYPISDPSWTWRAAARTPAFWLVMLAGTCSLFSLRMVTVHQVAHFVDNGVPRLTAATVFGSGGMITALSFVLFGQMSDKIGRVRAFVIGSVIQIVALVLLIRLQPGTPVALLYVYALFWGAGEGSRSGLLTAIASDLFPGPAVGTIVGTLGACFGAGAALGSWLGGFVFDLSGTYITAFSIALAATILATVSLALVPSQLSTKTTGANQKIASSAH